MLNNVSNKVIGLVATGVVATVGAVIVVLRARMTTKSAQIEAETNVLLGKNADIICSIIEKMEQPSAEMVQLAADYRLAKITAKDLLNQYETLANMKDYHIRMAKIHDDHAVEKAQQAANQQHHE